MSLRCAQELGGSGGVGYGFRARCLLGDRAVEVGQSTQSQLGGQRGDALVLKIGSVGQAKASLMRQRRLVDVADAWLQDGLAER